MKQVNKNHYRFEQYSHLDRWASYYYQLQLLLEGGPDNVLEIGVGDKVLKNYLKDNTNIRYIAIDIDEDLKPDVVGDVRQLPFKDNTFDTVCAFEVLEHIPFEYFEQALKEMKRVSKKNVLISLPHFGPPVQLYIKLPFIKFSFSRKIPVFKKHVFNGQHYWEIGKKGYSLKKIKKIMASIFLLKKDFVPFTNQYHHFFVLEK